MTLMYRYCYAASLFFCFCQRNISEAVYFLNEYTVDKKTTATMVREWEDFKSVMFLFLVYLNIIH